MRPQYDPRSQVASPILEYVGVGRRFVAHCVDAIILALFRNLALLTIDTMGLHERADAITTQGDAAHMFAYWLMHLDTFGVIQIGLVTIIPIFYFTVFEAAQGASLGKMLLGIRVVGLDGSPIGWGQSLGRNVLRIIDYLPSMYLLGALLVWTSSKKQRLGDRFADTVVVRRRR